MMIWKIMGSTISSTGTPTTWHSGTAAPNRLTLEHVCEPDNTRNDVEEGSRLARISPHVTVEARHKRAITALRLLTVLNVGFKYVRIPRKMSR